MPIIGIIWGFIQPYLGIAWGWAGSVFDIIKKHPIGAALILFIGLSGILASLYMHEKTKYNNEVQARADDRDAYVQAQKQAQATALANKVKTEKDNAEKAQAADAANTTLRNQYQLNLMRYKAAQGTTLSKYLSRSGTATQSSNGSSGNTNLPTVIEKGDNLLVIPLSDAQICADNTARLEVSRQWALSLKKAPPLLPSIQVQTQPEQQPLVQLPSVSDLVHSLRQGN